MRDNSEESQISYRCSSMAPWKNIHKEPQKLPCHGNQTDTSELILPNWYLLTQIEDEERKTFQSLHWFQSSQYVKNYSSQNNLYLGSHSTLYRPTASKHIRQTSKSHTNLQPATNRPTIQCVLLVFCLAQLVSAKSTAVTKAALQDPATVTQIPPTVATSHVSMLVACRI